MYVFIPEPLPLDKKLMCFSLGKTTPLPCFDNKTEYSALLGVNNTHSQQAACMYACIYSYTHEHCCIEFLH